MLGIYTIKEVKIDAPLVPGGMEKLRPSNIVTAGLVG